MGDILEKVGIIRKIDDLGRIVIPKEIRKFLKIYSDSDIEMKVIDEKIILNKVDSFESNEFLRKIIRIFSLNLKIDILLTSFDKIKCSYMYTKRKLLTEDLDNDIVEVIENRQERVLNNSSLIKDKHNLLIVPLIINGDIKGSVIFINNSNEKIFNTNYSILLDILKIYLE